MKRGLWVFFFISTLFLFNAAHADDADVLLHKTDSFDIAPNSTRSAIIPVNGSTLLRHLNASWTLHLEIDRARSPLDRFRINIRDHLSRLFPSLFPVIVLPNNQQAVGWVWWNGRPILEPRDFSRQPRGTFILSRPINLRETNELQFHLKGPRGSSGKITITGLVPLPSPPVLNLVTSPTSSDTQNLTGTAEPGALVQIDFNGQSSTLTASSQDGSFTKSLNLNLDDNTVSVTQVDRFGLISEEASAVIVRENLDQDRDGYSIQVDDCDDSNDEIHPGADEKCDGVDNNCVGGVDEAEAIDASLYYRDEDRDDFGRAGAGIRSCSDMTGYVKNATDCDDGNSAIFPNAPERCDGVDNNCVHGIDEATAVDARVWHLDADGDGFGNAEHPLPLCTAPNGYVGNATDCDDAKDTTNPDALEICDNADNNCNTQVDENVPRCFNGTLDPLPPHPEDVAPDLKKTVVESFFDRVSFLVSGNEPVQTGVQPNIIDPTKVSVIRGKILQRDNSPLEGVYIEILNHPEYGKTRTREDGLFDLVVNGGTTLTINYTLDGYLPAQRTLPVAVQDYGLVEDVVMISVDTAVTTIDLSASEMKVAQGSPVTDMDGTRQSTVLFPANITATMDLSDGTTQSIDTLNVRATEYTVGNNGPEAMPGALPATSGYTYAFELSVDEALSAGATSIRFNEPLIYYVDNFLNFPVGGLVPTGYYDKKKAAWVPSENGRIIKILSITNGKADVDVDGTGQPADATKLATLKITPEEQTKLATLYTPGKTLWRVPIPHFTPWDCNWPAKPKTGAVNPTTLDNMEVANVPVENPECKPGSIIECENQALGEAFPVTGTEFSLHYKSDRFPSWKPAYTLNIPLIGATIPPVLKRIDVQVEIAGREIVHSVNGDAVQANQVYPFTWDGLDVYGREVSGPQEATVRLGYVYEAEYTTPTGMGQAFAQFGSNTAITGVRARNEITLWQIKQRTMGTFTHLSQKMGGWSLNVHHTYDSKNKILYLGNGQRRSSQMMEDIIVPIAGTGTNGTAGNNGPALSAQVSGITGLAVDSKGNIYFSEFTPNRIRKIDAVTGIISIYAGDGRSLFAGEGVPALQASFFRPMGLTVDRNDNLYVADSTNNRIRKIDPQGIVTTVAGDGQATQIGTSNNTNPLQDYVPALSTSLRIPTDVAVDAEGNIYIADAGNKRVRKVDTNGIITTLAGGGSSTTGDPNDGDGNPAPQAVLCGDSFNPHTNPIGIEVDSEGNLIIAESCRRVRRVTPDGIIRRIAGRQTARRVVDGELAIDGALWGSFDILIDSEKNILFSEGAQRIRKVNASGRINTVAGEETQASNGPLGNYGPAKAAQLNGPKYMAYDFFGNLIFSEAARIRKVAPAFPSFRAGNIGIASEDGSEVYQFDSQGRHLKTVDAKTGRDRYVFGYDSNGLLTTITDSFSRITRIQRDISGTATGILSPDNLQTTLIVVNSRLEDFKNPANETYHFTYYPVTGALETLRDPKGNITRFEYHPDGRLKKDQDPRGGFKQLSRTDNGRISTVTLSTQMGRTTTYRTELKDAETRERFVTGPDGLVTTKEEFVTGKQKATYPDGTEIVTEPGPDPRFLMQAPVNRLMSIKMPAASLELISSTTKTATLTNPSDPLSLATETVTQVINGKTWTTVYDQAQKKFTLTSPLGRKTYLTINDHGQVTKSQMTNLADVDYTYYPNGRLWKVTQTSSSEVREYEMTYNPKGFLQDITDPRNQVGSFTYDNAGRVLTQTSPGNTASSSRLIGFTYDDNGNVETITPPGKPAHTFGYNEVNLEELYDPPAVPGVTTDTTDYDYNLDQQIDLVTRPDGKQIDYTYEANGRLDKIELLPAHDILDYGYDSVGRLQTIVALDGGTLTYSYDNSLLKTATWAGTVSGSVTRGYDNFFRINSYSVNGANPISFGYDDDGLLTSAGALSITRYPSHGLIDTTTLANVTSKNTYTGFGEIDLYTAKVSGSDIYSVDYGYDELGRVESKTEVINGATNSYSYTYYPSGFLESAILNGTTTNYTYDNNGNRLTKTGISGTAAYDDQDRLQSSNGNTYTYTANGELDTKTNVQGVTDYEYDEFGNLIAIELPDGTTIDYIIDGNNRRIGKMVNGSLVQSFLYQDQLEPIAELNGSGTVISRFIYGTKPHVPDYMIKGGVTYRIISDHLGSVRLVVNTSNGTIAQRIDYDEFGIVTQDTAPGFQPFGFAGGIYDYQTKLVRFGARDYDAEIGRWTSKDPIRFAGRDANLYGYVINNPVNLYDPLGQGPISAGICLVGVASGAVFAAVQYNDIANHIIEINEQLKSLEEESQSCGNSRERLKNEEKMQELRREAITYGAEQTKLISIGAISAIPATMVCGAAALAPLP